MLLDSDIGSVQVLSDLVPSFVDLCSELCSWLRHFVQHFLEDFHCDLIAVTLCTGIATGGAFSCLPFLNLETVLIVTFSRVHVGLVLFLKARVHGVVFGSQFLVFGVSFWSGYCGVVFAIVLRATRPPPMDRYSAHVPLPSVLPLIGRMSGILPTS